MPAFTKVKVVPQLFRKYGRDKFECEKCGEVIAEKDRVDHMIKESGLYAYLEKPIYMWSHNRPNKHYCLMCYPNLWIK